MGGSSGDRPAQLALGTVDAYELWGAEVTELYIVGLNKGRRQRDRRSRRAQEAASPLCTATAARQPAAAERRLAARLRVDDARGRDQRATRAHKRRGVWTLDEERLADYQAHARAEPQHDGGRVLDSAGCPENMRDKICFILGPMNRQDQQLASLLRSMAGEESRWQAVLWILRAADAGGTTGPAPSSRAMLDNRVLAAWACRLFGKEHQRESVPIRHHVGRDDPLGSGQYQPRLPHHTPELQQAIARGLLPGEAAEADEEE